MTNLSRSHDQAPLFRNIDAYLALTPEHPLVHRFSRLADKLLDLIVEGGDSMPWQTDIGLSGHHVDGWRLSACEHPRLSERATLRLSPLPESPKAWARSLVNVVDMFNATCLDWFVEFGDNKLAQRLPHAVFNKVNGVGAARIRLLSPWMRWSPGHIYTMLTDVRHGGMAVQDGSAEHSLLSGVTLAMVWRREACCDWLMTGHVSFSDGTGQSYPVSLSPSEILVPDILDAVIFTDGFALKNLVAVTDFEHTPRHMVKMIRAYFATLPGWQDEAGADQPISVVNAHQVIVDKVVAAVGHAFPPAPLYDRGVAIGRLAAPA